MKLLLTISRWFVGLLFIFSGLIKLNDPHGTAIKLDEYFVVFSSSFSSVFEIFIPAALFLSVLLSALEVILGIALIISFQTKKTVWILLSMIVFFTFLTFYSAITGKVTDCGCFGDAIPLTPWQSFYKDLILLVFIVFLFVKRKTLEDYSDKKRIIAFSAVSLASLFFALHCINHLPVKDFRPYKIGNDIDALMNDGTSATYHYIMEKDGEQKKFEKYPMDASWKYVESIEVEPGKDPTILDFFLFDKNGDDATMTVFEGKKLTLVFNKVGSLKTNIDWDALKALKKYFGEGFMYISSNPIEEPKYTSIVPDYYAIDETVAKAMVRSNPGIILWEKGIIKGKWHINDIPSVEEVKELLSE